MAITDYFNLPETDTQEEKTAPVKNKVKPPSGGISDYFNVVGGDEESRIAKPETIHPSPGTYNFSDENKTFTDSKGNTFKMETNLPKSYISAAPPKEPEIEKPKTFWTQTAKALLPKKLEEYFGLSKKPEQTEGERLKSAYEQAYAYEDLKRLEKEMAEGGGKLPEKTFGSVVGATPPEKYLPFFTAIPDIVEAVKIYNSAKRLENGENTMVDDYRLAKFVAENERDKTFGANVATLITQLPGFAGELLLTGGIYTAGKKATEKAVLKTFEKVLGKRLGVITTKVAGNVVGGTLQLVPARSLEITAGTIQNMTPEYSFTVDEMGMLQPVFVEKGEDLWKATAMSLGDQWVEVVSEHSGGIFNEALNPIKNQLVKMGIFKAFLATNPEAQVSDFMKWVNRAGWNGVLAEMGEERIGEVARGVLTEIGLSEQGWVVPTPEQLAIELVGFSIPGVMIMAANKSLEGSSFEPTDGGDDGGGGGGITATPIAEAEMIIGARDILAVSQGATQTDPGALTALQNVWTEYEGSMAQTIFSVKDTDESEIANIRVIEYPDGKWGVSYEINMAEENITSPFHSDRLSDTKEEAVETARENMQNWIEDRKEDATATQIAKIKKIQNALLKMDKDKLKEAEIAAEPEIEQGHISTGNIVEVSNKETGEVEAIGEFVGTSAEGIIIRNKEGEELAYGADEFNFDKIGETIAGKAVEEVGEEEFEEDKDMEERTAEEEPEVLDTETEAMIDQLDEFLLTLMTAEQAIDKTPQDLAMRWDTAYEYLETNMFDPIDKKLKAIGKSLVDMKGKKGKDVQTKRKELNNERDVLNSRRTILENRVQEENIDFQLALFEEAVKLGLENDDETKDELLQEVYERPGIEHNWNMKLKDIIAELKPQIEERKKQEATEAEQEEIEYQERQKKDDITTAEGAAKHYLRPYVERGDTLKSILDGGGGSYSDAYHSSIGGYVNGKKIGRDKIAIEELQGKKLNPVAIFSVKKLYDAIRAEGNSEPIKTWQDGTDEDDDDDDGDDGDDGGTGKKVLPSTKGAIEYINDDFSRFKFQLPGKPLREYKIEDGYVYTVINGKDSKTPLMRVGKEGRQSVPEIGDPSSDNNPTYNKVAEAVNKYLENAKGKNVLPSTKAGGKIKDNGKSTNKRVGSGTGQGELPETPQVGAGQPGDVGGTTEIGSGQVAPGRPDERGGGVGERPSARLTNNKEIEEFVAKYTAVDSIGRVELLTDELYADGFNLADFEVAAQNYKPAGGREKKGAEGRGLLDEYYTPPEVIALVRHLVEQQLGFTIPEKGFNILEPSAGTGAFLRNITDNWNIGNKVYSIGYEINRTAAGIAASVNDADNVIFNLPFESNFIDKKGKKKEAPQEYDIVIGNPPYGKHRGLYKGLGEEPKITQYEEYFIKRGLDLLNEDGVLAMVVPSSFLRGGETPGKNEISKVGELVEAYRLPNKIFGTTSIGTDIVVFIKRPPLTGKDSNDRLVMVERMRTMKNDAFFVEQPYNIIGKRGARKGFFGGKEPIVEGTIADVVERMRELNPDSYVPEITQEEETELKEVVEANYPGESPEEKAEILEAIEEEVQTGEITDEKAFVKNWSKDVNEVDEYLAPLSVVKYELGQIEKGGYEKNKGMMERKAALIKEIAEREAKEKKKPRFAKSTDKPTVKPTEVSPENRKAVLEPVAKLNAGLIDLQTLSKLDKKDKANMAFSINVEPTGEISPIAIREQKLPPKDMVRVANFANGLWYNNFNYFSGNIYEKLDQLDIDKEEMSDEQYRKQLDGLKKALPERITANRILVSPNTPFAENTNIYDPEQKQNIKLADAFLKFVDRLPREALGESSNWEIRGYVRQQSVTGSDKVRNNAVRVRRRETGDKLFKQFLTDGLDDKQKKDVEEVYNRQYNGYAKPDYAGVPLIGKVSDTFKGKKLDIKPVQLQGIGFLINKGMGLLAHDVGVGKTMQAIISVGEMLERKWASKPLIITPSGSVYFQWIKEIQDLLPGIRINSLANLGGDFKGNLETLVIEPGTISIITYDGFKRIGFRDETYSELTADLQDTIEKPGEILTKRKKELEKAQTEEQIGKGMKGTTAAKTFEELGFDMMVEDEVHNANHIITGAKLKDQGKATEFRGLNIRPSDLGIKTWMATQYIQKKNGNRNVMLLSAAPFTNNPMEYYSILSLLARKRLTDMGLKNVNEFMNTFMDLTYDFEVTADGKYKEKNSIKGFKNFQQFQRLLTEFIDFRDGEEAGVMRPNRISNEIIMHPTAEQVDFMDKAQELFSPAFKDKGGKLTGIGEMRKITFSPYMSRYYEGKNPTYKQFVDNSPKIRAGVEVIRQNKKDNPDANHVIYSPIGVEYFPLIKDYLVKEVGFEPKEVGIITGSVKGTERVKIQERFNNGEVKVIIGSDAIQEGVNLQEKTTDLIILALPWNFTELKQVIGRVWRQGNEWKNIRVHQVFIENSVDVFQSQKLEVKQKRYESSLKFKGDYLDIGDIDFDELKLDLITDPVMRVEVENAIIKRRLEKDVIEAKADYAYYARKAEKLVEKQEKISRSREEIVDLKVSIESGDEDGYWAKRLVEEEKDLAEDLAEMEKIKEVYRDQGIIDIKELADRQEDIDKKSAKLAEMELALAKKIEAAKLIRVENIIKENDYGALRAKLAKQNTSFFQKVKPTNTQVDAPGGSGEASVGAYIEGEPILLGNMDKIHPVEFPELVELATELMGQAPTVKKMRTALGRFTGRGRGEIKLHPDLFTDGNNIQLARAMAHEVGHLTDYIPDLSMSHGSLKNRILVVRNDMIKSFGESVKDGTYRDELKKASLMWRPWDREQASERLEKYRDSGKELYADAISMLYNNPGLLEQVAPKFYRAYFENLDNKPEMNEAYWELQDLLRGAKEELFWARENRIRKGFQKASDIQRGFREKEIKASKRLWTRLQQQLIDKYYPGLKKVYDAEADGKIIDDSANPKYLLNEIPFINNDIYLFVEKMDREISQPIKAAGMNDEDIGIYLTLIRIMYGRTEIANPFGFSPANADVQLGFLKDRVGAENFSMLEDKLQIFHDEVFKEASRAVDVGSYNSKTFESSIVPNRDNYAAFAVVDYLEPEISPMIEKMEGTLKAIANPYHFTIMKVAGLKKLNTWQEAKNSMRDLLKEFYPDEIARSAEVRGEKLVVFEKPRDDRRMTLLENGRIVGYDIDPLIAKSFKTENPDDLFVGIRLLGIINQKFKSLVTTYNLGFTLGFNPKRDWSRTFKAIPSTRGGIKVRFGKRKMTFFNDEVLIYDMVKAYIQSLPSAYRFAKGQLDEFTRNMVAEKMMVLPMNDFNYDPRDDDMGAILKKYGVLPKDLPPSRLPEAMVKARTMVLKPFIKLLNGLRFIANTTEVLGKIAGTKVRMQRGETGKALAYNVRTFTSTPNWRTRGTITSTTNEIFIFSNIMKEGIKSDYILATDPKTRSGYWWKSTKYDLVPKFLMFLASIGVFGAKLKEMFDKQSEYDKTNYIMIPIGEQENGKPIFVRIPHDETGRLVSAMFWKMLNFSKDRDINGLQDIISIGAGQLPNITPVITILEGWRQYLTGRNPYDAFRGRTIIDDTTFTAGGADALKKMVEWTTNEFGLTRFATYDTSKNTGLETFMQVAPFFNRIIKISDYGDQERLRSVGDKVEQERAKQNLYEREVIRKYIDQATAAGQLSLFATTKYGNAAVREIIGHTPRNQDEVNHRDRILQKFRLASKRELADDPRYMAIIDASSNDEKKAILRTIKAETSEEEWKAIKVELIRLKIVTTEVMYSVK